MPQQVVNGAQLSCSMGSAPSALTVLPINRVESSQQFAATIMDHVPLANIMPFGMCQTVLNPMVALATIAKLGTLTPQPCIPVTLVPWTPGAPQTQIASIPALDDTCTCLCLWLGEITVSNPGQSTETID